MYQVKLHGHTLKVYCIKDLADHTIINQLIAIVFIVAALE